ncbi:MAG: tetratricopeptide repeat protein [Myxococcota bacterium]|jgi:Flp pilus assembly protein TadD|nr:tetratricopeptide repeat protein [Myxococcota bacterium]
MAEQQQNRREVLEQARKAATGKRLEQAADLLEELLTREPADIDALDMLGFVRFFQGRFEDSRTACEKALAHSPDHAYAHKGLGLNLARLGQLEAGIVHLKRAMELRPTWSDPPHDLAVVLFEHGRTAEALAILDARIEQHPQLADKLSTLRAQLARATAAK